jgi:HD-GYP domain-containing protein (c-di-GMP phosphodiesterase class II)
MTKSINTLELDAKLGLELINRVSKKISLVPDMARLLEQIVGMTQKTLHAKAASILLFHDNQRELFFEAASGPVKNVLRHVKVNIENSIAGQVVRTGKPMIINDVNTDLHFQKHVDQFTGFVTKSIICIPLMTYQRTIGALEVINKLDGSNFDETDIQVLIPVATTAAMAIENAAMAINNTKLHQTILDAYKCTIMTLAGAIDAKDPYTRGHSQRVMEFAMLSGSSLLLSEEEMETLEYASILHDVGKIIVDSQILNKPENLTAIEWSIIRAHPANGANLLKDIPFLKKASHIILSHHERYDGKGYPNGLEGEDIPLCARIIAVADAFDTMTTNQSYRLALDIEYAINELKNGVGTQFCPVAVEAFISGFRARVKIESFSHA